MKFKAAAAAAKGYVTESMCGFDEIDAFGRPSSTGTSRRSPTI